MVQSKPKILVAMPAYNEERYIGSLILKAQQYGSEVLVIDDGSKDGTAMVAALAGAIVIRHEENQGKGAAIQRILAEARKRRPDTLVLLDADAQHDPDDIPALLEAVSRGSDIVIGSRVRKGSGIPHYRRVGQIVLSFLSRVLSGVNVNDSECGFRALSSKAVDELKLKQKGFAIDAEMISIASEKGLTVTEIPISVLYTQDGSTLNPVVHGFHVLTKLLMMISERRPAFFFGLGGGIAVILGLIAGIRTSQILSLTGVLPTGTALISVLLITIGVLSIFTGIIINTLIKMKR